VDFAQEGQSLQGDQKVTGDPKQNAMMSKQIKEHQRYMLAN
jgi:hypothetical protein